MQNNVLQGKMADVKTLSDKQEETLNGNLNRLSFKEVWIKKGGSVPVTRLLIAVLT